MSIYWRIRSVKCLSGMALAAVLLCMSSAAGHCQIPCGIYDDAMRFTMLREHITTIEKSMNQIRELSTDPGANPNQLIRWVINKDDHADQFADIVSYYFLQQRIIPPDGPDSPEWDAYVHKVVLCHRMMVEVMRCKETTDLDHVKQLRELVGEFREAYLADDGENDADDHRREDDQGHHDHHGHPHEH